ncbi:MAG: hypothetical protein NT055_08910, partial [Nitrospirae bacterium]|nr:hypothetical protein [Nitrospirota bacterium]
HGLRRQGTDCNKGLVDPGSIKLSCLYPITYIPHLNVGGRIKPRPKILQNVAFYVKVLIDTEPNVSAILNISITPNLNPSTVINPGSSQI